MARVRDALHAAYQCGTERNRPGFQQIDGALHRFLLGVRGARGAAPLDLEKLAAEVYEDANGQGWHSATRAEQDEYRAKVKRWVGGAAGSPEDAMRAAWDYHLAHHGTPDATCAICVGVSEGERKP